MTGYHLMILLYNMTGYHVMLSLYSMTGYHVLILLYNITGYNLMISLWSMTGYHLMILLYNHMIWQCDRLTLCDNTIIPNFALLFQFFQFRFFIIFQFFNFIIHSSACVLALGEQILLKFERLAKYILTFQQQEISY